MTHLATDGIIELPVRGKSSLQDEIEQHTLTCLDHSNSTATITCVAGSGIKREHSATMTEISATVIGSELVSGAHVSLPYGANPRNPILCNAFDKIYSTISEEPTLFVLRNTGIDVFCSKAELDVGTNQIELTFENDRHGIANGGLTTGVIRYCSENGIDLEQVRVSLRVWASDDFDLEILVDAADARNLHRPLALADRLNSLGAFGRIKEKMSEDFRSLYSFYTGDENADFGVSRDAQQLCHLLYGFTHLEGEAHPIYNNDPAAGVVQTIKKEGRIKAPKKGIITMKGTVNLE